MSARGSQLTCPSAVANMMSFVPSPLKSATQYVWVPCSAGMVVVVAGCGFVPPAPADGVTVIVPVDGSIPAISGGADPGTPAVCGTTGGGWKPSQAGSGLGGFEQLPLVGSQVPARWH